MTLVIGPFNELTDNVVGQAARERVIAVKWYDPIMQFPLRTYLFENKELTVLHKILCMSNLVLSF